MTQDVLYSRVVLTTKLLLPLAALALLSVMFYVSGRPNPENALAAAPVDVEQRALEQRLTDPWFSGMANEGETFSVKADVARPDIQDPRQLTTEVLSVAINNLSGGNTLYVKAAHGLIDTGNRRVQLSSDVSVRSSLDFALSTQEMMADFNSMDIFAPTKVEGTSPLGTIVADQMRVTRRAEDGTQLMLFEGNVQLLYQPG